MINNRICTVSYVVYVSNIFYNNAGCKLQMRVYGCVYVFIFARLGSPTGGQVPSVTWKCHGCQSLLPESFRTRIWQQPSTTRSKTVTAIWVDQSFRDLWRFYIYIWITSLWIAGKDRGVHSGVWAHGWDGLREARFPNGQWASNIQ